MQHSGRAGWRGKGIFAQQCKVRYNTERLEHNRQHGELWDCSCEALLSGKPCIVSHDGGLKEIVTEETGFVCSTLDEYVNAIKKIDSIDSSKCRERGLY